MKPTRFSLYLLVSLALLLAACGQTGDEQASRSVRPTEESPYASLAVIDTLPQTIVTRENVNTLTPMGALGFDGQAITLSPTESLAAVRAGGNGAPIGELYDFSNGQAELIRSFDADTDTDLVFSPDGTRLAIFTGAIRLVDVETNELLMLIETGSDSLGGGAFSPDGQLLAAAFFGGFNSQVMIWDVNTREMVREFPRGNVAGAVTFSPDGSMIAFDNSDRDRIIVVDSATGETITEIPQEISRLNDLYFSPDGTLLAGASRNSNVYLWDVEISGAIYEFRDIFQLSANNARFSPDGELLAVTSTLDNVWHILDLTTGDIVFSADGDIDSVAWLPDGAGLITLGVDGAVVWGVEG